MVKTVLPLQGHGFDPGWGAKIPHATRCGQKKFFKVNKVT